MDAPIDWGDTGASDVRGYLFTVSPPEADVSGGDVLGAVDAWFGRLSDSMKAAGIPTSDQVLHGVGDTMTNADRALEGAAANIGGGLAKAGGNAASSAVSAVAPYLLAAGLVWVALEVRRAR
jgi:hypothetical protein